MPTFHQYQLFAFVCEIGDVVHVNPVLEVRIPGLQSKRYVDVEFMLHDGCLQCFVISLNYFLFHIACNMKLYSPASGSNTEYT